MTQGDATMPSLQANPRAATIPQDLTRQCSYPAIGYRAMAIKAPGPVGNGTAPRLPRHDYQAVTHQL